MPEPAAESKPSIWNVIPLRMLLGLLFMAALLSQILTLNPTDWKLARAQGRSETDPAEALADVDAALDWSPRNIDALRMRIALYVQLGDLPAAIETVDKALAIASLTPDERQGFLQMRAELRQRLGQHTAAIRDASEVLKIGESNAPAGQLEQQLALMQPRNFRAYVVARAAAAGDANAAQVADAQRDMRQVFAGLAKVRTASADEPHAALEYWLSEASLVDTAAYLEMSAGNLPAALRDLNRVLELCDLLDVMLQRDEQELSSDVVRANVNEVAKIRAVALHHRGEVLLRLRDLAAAQRDMQLAKSLGYNVAAGNW